MGYDLHITRKASWSDGEGPTIIAAEWRAMIDRDAKLSLDREIRGDDGFTYARWKGESGTLGWCDGEILAKNPDKPLIRKMVQIAQKLHAKVEGDDGEVYREDGSSSEPEVAGTARPGIFDRVASWLSRRRAARKLRRPVPAFRVGQRVKDSFGRLGTVVAVDAKAYQGLGSLRVRLDDGQEDHAAYVASGYEIVDGADARHPRGF